MAGNGQNSPVCVGGGAGFLRISEVLNNNCVLFVLVIFFLPLMLVFP